MFMNGGADHLLGSLLPGNLSLVKPLSKLGPKLTSTVSDMLEKGFSLHNKGASQISRIDDAPSQSGLQKQFFGQPNKRFDKQELKDETTTNNVSACNEKKRRGRKRERDDMFFIKAQ